MADNTNMPRTVLEEIMDNIRHGAWKRKLTNAGYRVIDTPTEDHVLAHAPGSDANLVPTDERKADQSLRPVPMP